MVLATLELPARRSHVPEQQGAEQSDGEERVLISGRVKATTRRRLRIYAAAHDESLQDLLDRALDEFLNRNGG